MATPTPVFPTAIATDAQLKVANNLVKSSLKVSAAATDTILFVTSTAGFVPNCLVSIDKEIISVASIAAGPNPSLVVASGGRGFDGTAAAQHSAGAAVSMLIDAWHHNVLAGEVKAIETALGANLINVSGDTRLISTKYIFTPQTPGGTLTAGVANVITLAPVPRGINGTDTNHDLYISGGTGTAEVVRIAGGTAVSGAASGTIIVTPANAHSGAWTIQSATAGIQETIVSGGVNFEMYIPAGVHHIYGEVYLPSSAQARILGAGMGLTQIAPHNMTGASIWLEANPSSFLEFGSLMITRSGIGYGTSDIALVLNKWSGNAYVHDVGINYPYVGIQCDGSPLLERVSVGSFQNTGIHGTGARFGGTFIEVSVGSGMDTGQGSTAPYAVNIDTTVDGWTCIGCAFGGADYGVRVNPGASYASNFFFSACDFERYNLRGYFQQQDSASQGGSIIKFDNCRFVGINKPPDIIAIMLVSVGSILLDAITVDNCYIALNVVAIRLCGTSNVTIGGNVIQGSDLTSMPEQDGVILDNLTGNSSNRNVTISGNTIGYGAFSSTARTNRDWVGGPLERAIRVITGGAGSYDRLTITGNVLFGMTGYPIRLDQIPNALVIRDNAGIDDVSSTTIVAAATINFQTGGPFRSMPFFTLTGSTGVTAVSGLWEGAKGMFLATDPAPGAWTAGATIGKTFTPTTNVPVAWEFRNGKIWLK
jgi:hypothetical protein